VIDYTIMAPSDMARFSPSIPLMDMPFLFCDLVHWNAALSRDARAALQAEPLETADIIIAGYTGDGIRNLISSDPVANIEELSGHRIIPQDARYGRTYSGTNFCCTDVAPSAIAYNEVYNAIQIDVIT